MVLIHIKTCGAAGVLRVPTAAGRCSLKEQGGDTQTGAPRTVPGRVDSRRLMTHTLEKMRFDPCLTQKSNSM